MNSTGAADLPGLPGIAGHHDAIFTVVSVFVALAACLPLNGYVAWMIVRGVGGSLSSDFFTLTLAVSEITYSLCCLLYIVYFKLKSFLCFEMFMFPLGLVLTARPLLQCCISVECFVGVLHPVLFLRFKRVKRKAACCSVVALLVLTSCFYCLYTYSNPLYLYGFFCQNLLVFFIMSYCCLAVARALRLPGPGETTSPKVKGNKAKRKAFKRILLIMISLAINFFFIIVVTPLQCCLTPNDFTRALAASLCLAMLSGFTQPLLHLHRNRKLICPGGSQ